MSNRYKIAGAVGAAVLASGPAHADMLDGPPLSFSATSKRILNALPPASPQGRLTLASGTPVMATSQTSMGVVYYDCLAGGNSVPVWNGTNDVSLPITACEISAALQTTGTGVLNANGVFDFWGVNASNALSICAATNGLGGGWASDTAGSNIARGTGYSQLDSSTRPYVTNKNAISHCYTGSTDRGTIPANQATYLGTVLTDASSAGLVSFTFGSNAAGGGAARFGVWNGYNRVQITTQVLNSDASWSYNVANTWRAADGATNSTTGSATFRITYVTGASQEGVTATYKAICLSGSAGTNITSGIGVDSTSAQAGDTGWSNSTSVGNLPATYSNVSGSGSHFISALELNSTTTTSTCFGNSSNAISSLYGVFRF